jgi:outer membrane protein assembly factor BamA
MPLQGDTTLFREQWQELGYKRQGAGIAAGVLQEFLREPLTDISRMRVGLRYQLEWVRRYDIDPSLLATDPATIVEGSQIVARITPGLTLDYRDNVLDPSRAVFTPSRSISPDRIWAARSACQVAPETAWYLDWLSPVVIAVGGRLGLATPLSDTAALPIEDRFYAGGTSSVRGYPQDKIGPLDSTGNPTGGNALVILNAEGRFPIWRWLSGVVFVDTGAVAPEVSDLGSAAFKTEWAAVSRQDPVGPLRLDVGYALRRRWGRWQLCSASDNI